MRTSLLLWLTVGFVSCSLHQAFALGADGHEAVCEIAYQELTPAARQAVDQIMSAETDERFQTFRQSCVWPDYIGPQRARSAEHYVNVPRYWRSKWYETCPEAPTCLFTGIWSDIDVLTSATTTAQERLTALKFLGHWIGDIHQPLHISFSDDRGGNDILLAHGFGCDRNLHSVWDSCIADDIMKEMDVVDDREQFGRRLQEEVTNAERQVWTATLSPLEWANESFRIARQPDVQYCTIVGQRCQYTPDRLVYVKDESAENDGKRVLDLTSAYEEQQGPIMKQRIKMAGVRLGAILNAYLGQ